MSEQELWAAISELKSKQVDNAKRLDELEQWVERLSKATSINSDTALATFDLIRSQIQIARKQNDLN
jgi:hypothetical protein